MSLPFFNLNLFQILLKPCSKEQGFASPVRPEGLGTCFFMRCSAVARLDKASYEIELREGWKQTAMQCGQPDPKGHANKKLIN